MDSDAASGCLLVVVLALAFCAGGAVGYVCTGNHVRQQAIDAGVAEWTIDEKTGVREFRWLPQS